MLTIIIREFLAICEYLKKIGAKTVKGYFVVERTELEILLDKNKYLPSLEKLKCWKALNWIDADENQTTRKVCVDGVRKRCVKLDIGVYEMMRELSKRTQKQ